jgi:hypothetical protein
LRKIVRQTVSELQSSNVEDTVEALMEATTERLVLVNTPESGAHVRFDIRPLQEFFAAEFIYEDVSADQIGDRLAIVAGDAHWREVMHFLLSALVENSRRTDLAVAVEKLALLDERVVGSAARLFYRRLAAGAFIATRLMAEGVLGQDKRVRQQFKRCIEPVFGIVDPGLISTLASTHDEDSVSWLIDVLVDTLIEQSESESIGAAFALCLMLTDEQPRAADVESIIMTKSMECRACLLEALAADEDGDPEIRRQLPCWVMRIAVRCFASAEWVRMSVEGVAASFRIMGCHDRDLPAIALAAGLEPQLAQLCVPLLTAAGDLQESGSESLGGMFFMEYHAPDPRLDSANWSDDLLAAIARAPGIFSLLRPTFAIASGNRTEGVLASLLDAGEFLRSLPEAWKAYLPRQLLNGSIAGERGIAGSPTAAKISWERSPGYRYNVMWMDSGNQEPSAFEKLLRSSPNRALDYLILFPLRKGRQEKIDRYTRSPEGQRLTENVCTKHRHLLADNPPLWGRLLDICKSDAIRHAILTAPSKGVGHWVSGGKFYPFFLRLPEESALLPSIMNTLFSYNDVVARFANRQTVSEIILEYVPDIRSLMSIVEADVGPKQIAAAAAMLCLRHPGLTPQMTDKCIRKVVSCYETRKNSWYLSSAAVSLELLERIPVRFEHSLHGERSFCILVG